MSRVRIVHRSGYHYAPWAMASHNEARMTPRSSHEQLVISNKIVISPTAWQNAHTDYWGNSVLSFEIHERHQVLNIVATSDVDVQRRVVERDDRLQWAALDDPRLRDDLYEMLQPTGCTDVSGFLGDLVTSVKQDAGTPMAFVRTLQQRISAQVTALGTGGSADTAGVWALGTGGIRDLSHLLVGAARLGGVPARFVSGYHCPEGLPEVGQTRSGQARSWVQVWDDEWVAIDSVSGGAPDESYIEIAFGRDHYDAAPLKGIFTGGRTRDLYVDVSFSRVS